MSNTFDIALADNRKPYWIWGPLAFSIFYFLPLIFSFEKFTAERLLGMAGIFAIFILLYIKATFAHGRNTLIAIVAIVLLSTFGTYVTPGTQALFGYAAFFTGFYYTMNRGIWGLALIVLSILLAAKLFGFTDAYFLAPALIVSIGMFFFGHAERRDRMHSKKEEKSQAQIEQLATIAERERIARDLHDLVGHSLSSIALKAELAQKLMDKENTEQARVQINEVADLSRRTLAEIRHAVSGLKQVNLTGQIAKLTKELSAQGFNVEEEVNIKQLSPQVESQLMLIITELVTNILRHSNGNQVELSLVQKDGISLRVFDNGTGSTSDKGNGLTGIKERCQQLGTMPNISYGNGFSVSIFIQEETND